MTTAKEFIKFSWLIVLFRYNSSLTNSTQFGNDSNYSKFSTENIATNCSWVTVSALDSLTRNTLATTLSWKFFPSDHQVDRSIAKARTPRQVFILFLWIKTMSSGQARSLNGKDRVMLLLKLRWGKEDIILTDTVSSHIRGEIVFGIAVLLCDIALFCVHVKKLQADISCRESMILDLLLHCRH